MLKKIRDKKIEQFKKDFPQFQISKKTGSVYMPIGETEISKTVKINGRAVTKNTINQLGKTRQWKTKNARNVYLISNAGRLMIKQSTGNFKTVTLKTVQVYDDLRNTFFIGKKYEYLKDYPDLFPYRFFQNFNSLSEAKKHLGYSFISDQDFYNCFNNFSVDTLSVMILAKDKKNAVRLIKNIDSEDADTLRDYIEMCQENNLSIEIPAGKNKLEELHDSAMWEVNKINADNYSKEYRYDIKEEFTKVWKERGLQFKRLETPYEMYTQGIKQIHCIGTNYATTLNRYAFYTFTYENKEYDIQIYDNGNVGQFYGRKNSATPYELRDKVKKDINLKFSIVDTKPNLDNYPLIEKGEKEGELLEQCEMQTPW